MGQFFISFFNENCVSKQNSPRWDAVFCGITSGAILFPYISHKKDVLNVFFFIFYTYY